jgi:hypothetical protein
MFGTEHNAQGGEACAHHDHGSGPSMESDYLHTSFETVCDRSRHGSAQFPAISADWMGETVVATTNGGFAAAVRDRAVVAPWRHRAQRQAKGRLGQRLDATEERY